MTMQTNQTKTPKQPRKLSKKAAWARLEAARAIQRAARRAAIDKWAGKSW